VRGVLFVAMTQFLYNGPISFRFFATTEQSAIAKKENNKKTLKLAR
jgi:hypothetical protein